MRFDRVLCGCVGFGRVFLFFFFANGLGRFFSGFTVVFFFVAFFFSFFFFNRVDSRRRNKNETEKKKNPIPTRCE